MRYAIVIEAEETAAAWIHAALDAGEPVPRPSALVTLRGNLDYQGRIDFAHG